MSEEIRHEKKPEIRLANITQSDSDDTIYDSDKIESILKKLEKQHSLLTAYVGKQWRPCSTLLLEINRDQEYLVIDEFCPGSINLDINIDTNITITGNNAGITVNFPSRITDIADKDGVPYYKIPFPESIEYCQRRQTYRVPVTVTNPVNVVFSTGNDLLMHGELRDISLGGFSARLKQPVLEELGPGDEIPKCILQIPGGGRIVCSVQVRRKFETIGSGIQMIGVMFEDINKQDRRTLEQLIAKLEREMMKTIKR